VKNPVKINRLAMISFGSGIIVILSLFLYWALYQITYSSSPGYPLESENRILLTIMDLSVTGRNFYAPVALITGVLALIEIKKRDGAEKGKLFASAGIAFGAGWIIFKLMVGLIFLLAEYFH